MFEIQEWFERVTIPIGGMATWWDRRLRLWLAGIEPIDRRGRLARWFGPAVPPDHRLRVEIETPTLQRFTCATNPLPLDDFPKRLGPYYERENTPPLASDPASVFEIVALDPSGSHATVCAGRGKTPPDAVVQGDLAALDPSARRFVRAWLEWPLSLDIWDERAPAVIPMEIEGYSLRLGASTTASRLVTFHRDGDRFYVRTHGGCFRATTTWHGPFVARRGSYELADG